MLRIEELPYSYLKSMKELLVNEYDDYISSLNKPHFSGLRVNNLKIDNDKLLQFLQKDLKKIPWIYNGYYTGENDRFAKNPYYHAGLYYLQEPSAMTPAAFSEVQAGDKVLDLCAAPGGKSTELAARLGGEGLLVSNDISASRARALLKNIELAGIGNALITCEEPPRLVGEYKEYFDKIIVDAPCSGEGMFRKDSSVLSAYLKHGPEFFAPIQEGILDAAADMLLPGGHIIYSTCTYSYIEDEGSVENFLGRHSDFEVEPIAMAEGFTESKCIPGCVRLFPHKIDGEGHFIAKLKKKGINPKPSQIKSKNKILKIPEECREFISHIYRDFDCNRMYINKEYVYYLPKQVKLSKKIHYLRTGLLLGRIKYNRFEPSQALAMNLRMDEFDKVFNLSIEDERVMRYLKGETINSDYDYKGYVLVCLDGYPLGWAKQNGRICKNKYYPGWRWQ